MILDVIKEGEYTSNNTKRKFDNVEKNVDKVQLKRIRELLDEKELRYVSPNVRELLGITKLDDPECFTKKTDVVRRVVQVGEKFRVILYIRLSQEDGDLEEGDVSGSIKNNYYIYWMNVPKEKVGLLLEYFVKKIFQVLMIIDQNG